jgi:2-methylcitrate dehydratase PrpD
MPGGRGVTLARELVRALRAAPALPETVADLAALHLLDAVGVGLAASAGEPGRAYHGAVRKLGAGGPASVLGLAGGASPALAALANGGLIHALEYDDTHTGSIAHGSSVLAPTVLAAGEARPDLPGSRLLHLFALGWEILIRIGLAAPGSFQREGFQVTSVAGALVSALLAAEAAGASEDEAVAAIGIALSQASGVFEFLTNGATVKSLHPGWAAHGGLCAAALAGSGLTGPETSLEGRLGLFSRFAADGKAPERLRRALADLGRRWHLADAAFKFHPCCHYIHPFLQALDRIERDGFDLPSLEAMTCRVPPGQAPIICEPWERRLAPGSAHEMRYSLPVVLALRIVEGGVDLRSFERPPSAPVLALARRIGWEPLDGADFPNRFQAVVAVRGGGGMARAKIDDVFGGPSDPAPREAVLAKFRDNAGRAGSPEAVRDLEAAILGLGAGGIGTVTPALRPFGAPGPAGAA